MSQRWKETRENNRKRKTGEGSGKKDVTKAVKERKEMERDQGKQPQKKEGKRIGAKNWLTISLRAFAVRLTVCLQIFGSRLTFFFTDFRFATYGFLTDF